MTQVRIPAHRSITSLPAMRPRASGSDGTRAALIAGALVLVAALAQSSPAHGDSIQPADVSLPFEISSGAAIWDGQAAYLFGSCFANCSGTDSVFRYHPATSTVSVLNGVFPVEFTTRAAVWDGENAYIFGGRNATGAQDVFFDQIWRYSPGDATATLMSSRLPSKRAPAAAVWDGRFAYIFGGKDEGFSPLNDIVRYDPATDTISTVDAVLPYFGWPSGGALAGGGVYLFGGQDSGLAPRDDIIVFDPSTATATTLDATLPSPRYGSSVASDGRYVYVFGGYNFSEQWIDEIVRFDSQDRSVDVMSARLPTPRSFTSSVWDEDGATILGGSDYASTGSQDVLRYTLEPGTPSEFRADPGGALGSIDLTWSPPAANTFTELSGYRIYRTDGGAPTMIAEVGTTSSHTIAGLRLLVTYRFRISAFNDSGESPLSEEVCAKPFPWLSLLGC